LTDGEKLLTLAAFMNNEGFRAEDAYKLTLNHRTVRYRECDVLDLVELMELKIRLDYFVELSAVICNVLYGTFNPRPPYYPLTGLRYPDIL